MKKYNFKRELAVEVSPLEDPNLLTLSVASSAPYLRTDKNGKSFYEILVINEDSVDFERLVDGRCPFLMDHDTSKQIGVCEKAWIEDEKVMATIRFSKNRYPQDILSDMKDGIRRNVSIGYSVDGYHMEKIPEFDYPVMFVDRFTIYEISQVACPADPYVGVERALENVDDEMEDKECGADKTPEEETKEDEPTDEAPAAGECKEAAPEVAEEAPEKKECGEDEEEEEATKELDADDEDEEDKARLAEIEEIRSLSELTNTKELAEKFISEKRSLDEFKTEIKNLKDTENNTLKDNTTMENNFSLLRAIRGYTSKAPADFAESYEYKVNEENKRNFGITDADIVLTAEQLRAFDGNEALNQVVYRPDLYTGVLRPESVLAKTGARVVAVDGPSISFSVATSGVNAGWVDINGSVPSATMDFALRQLTPKKAGAFVDISFQSLLQDDPSAEAIVMDDIVKALDQVLDEGAIKGTGSDGQPSGIITNGDINTVPVSGAFTLSGVYGMEAKIRESYDYSPNLKFVCNTKNYYKYATTPYSAVEQNRMLLEDGKMIGHDVVICNALDDNTIILGNFDELVMANFRGITLKIVEDATLARKQAVEIVAHAAVDFLCRRPKSFTKTVSA